MSTDRHQTAKDAQQYSAGVRAPAHCHGSSTGVTSWHPPRTILGKNIEQQGQAGVEERTSISGGDDDERLSKHRMMACPQEQQAKRMISSGEESRGSGRQRHQSDLMVSGMSTDGRPATGPAVTNPISRVQRRNEPDGHNDEDKGNDKKAKVAINSCDKKLGSKEDDVRRRHNRTTT